MAIQAADMALDRAGISVKQVGLVALNFTFILDNNIVLWNAAKFLRK